MNSDGDRSLAATRGVHAPVVAPRARVRSRSRSQAGTTLVEALVSIAILSILLLGVMAGITTSLKSSNNNHDVALVRGVFTTITDRSATMAFPGCSLTNQQIADQIASSIEIPAGYVVSVTGVRNLLPKSATCSAQTSVRLLEMTVASADGTASLSGEVVVRDLKARPA